MAWYNIKAHLDAAEQSVNRALERLTTSREDIRLQMRAARMYNLAQRNATATSEEIFTADFGTRHPKGLDITYPDYNHAVVNFTDTKYYNSLSSDKQEEERRSILGRGNANSISLNPRFYQKTSWKTVNHALPATLSHEHIHSLQYLDKEQGWDNTVDTSYTTGAFQQPRGTDWESRLKQGYQKTYQTLRDKWEKASGNEGRTKTYLSEDCEMQARLHEMLGQGYAIWQKMPTTKLELWAAMNASGLRTPQKILEKLDETEEGRQAKKTFAISETNKSKLRRDMVRDLNNVFNYAALPERREALWEHGYPHLYGNLLELYGDRLGRERMGLGPNPRAAKELMRQFVKDPEAITDETLPALAKDITPEGAARLIKNLAFTGIKDQSNMKTAALITKHLASRPDIRDHFNNMPDQTGLDMVPHPLFVAVNAGSAPLVTALLDAGVRPEANFACKHPFQGSDDMQDISIMNHLDNYRQTKELYEGLDPKSDEKEARRIDMELFKKGLQALADHPSSAEAYFVSSDLAEKKSLRELLAEAGFSPSSGRSGPASSSRPAAPGG